MSVSLPAMPSLPPMVPVPSAAQLALPAPATQLNSSVALPPTTIPSTANTTFANLIDELTQEKTQQTGASQPTSVNLAGPRIPLRTPPISSASSSARTVAAPSQKPLKQTTDNAVTFLPITPVQPSPVIPLRIVPPNATQPVEQAPQIQSTPTETLRVAPDDTVLQIHLRPLQTDVPAVAVPPAPPAIQKETPAPPAKPASASELQTSDDAQVPAIGDDAKPAGSQPDMSQGDSKHLPQRANSSEHEDAPKAAAAQPFVQTLSATHQMTVPAAVVEKPALPAAPAPPVPAAAHTAPPEPETPGTPQLQVRAVALEFTPDGGHDVRLRVVERAGDVHVTLHSNNAGLTDKLRDGVQDLAGSLTSAGYEGEAWTPRDGRQQQQQQQQELPAPARRRPRSEESSEEFAGLFGNPAQETK